MLFKYKYGLNMSNFTLLFQNVDPCPTTINVLCTEFNKILIFSQRVFNSYTHNTRSVLVKKYNFGKKNEWNAV